MECTLPASATVPSPSHLTSSSKLNGVGDGVAFIYANDQQPPRSVAAEYGSEVSIINHCSMADGAQRHCAKRKCAYW